MRPRFTLLLALTLCVGLACVVPQVLAKKKDKPADNSAEQKRAVHALNRLTFGPRPGDVQAVTAMGVDRWIDQQLHPEKINDKEMESRLEPLRTLRMSSKEIMEDFPDQPLIRQVMDGKHPMPTDPARRAVYEVQVARLKERFAKRDEKRQATQSNPLDKNQSGKDQAGSDQPKTDQPRNDQPKTDQQDQKEMAAASSVASPVPAASDASEGAKTAEELAAAAASAEKESSMAADNNATNGMPPPSAEASAKPAPMNDASMTPPADMKSTSAEEAEAKRREDRLYADLKIQSLIDLPPGERYNKVLAMSVDEQIALADSLRGGKGQEFLEGLDPKQRETLMAMNNPEGVVIEELSQAKLLRAIYSERQLEEVMTDFWFNHFNVFVGKGPERLLHTNYEKEVIRPNAMGKFEDLLTATAKSPAMLFYLDNWMSVGPNSMAGSGTERSMMHRRPGPYGPYGRPRPYPGNNPNARKKPQSSGLNENYGRELLELHTLSVNGGYSQRDVTEVAKVFTGWTIDKPLEGMSFRYDPRMHEPGPKFVLGKHIKPNGEGEGKEVLHMLATSPKTAHFISLKLAQRFVSDDPPPALVDRMAKTFEKKKGDIREVLSTMFHSPEFWADGAYRAKVKTPLEFVASAVRATGASVDNAMPLARQLNNMGMPLYGSQPPTGYSMKADTWVNSSALLNRMNFALALTSGKVRGVKVDAQQLAGGPPPPPDASATLSAMESRLLAADVSKQTHDSIVAQIDGSESDTPEKSKPTPPKPPDANTIAGLLIGSPEFQRR